MFIKFHNSKTHDCGVSYEKRLLELIKHLQQHDDDENNDRNL